MERAAALGGALSSFRRIYRDQITPRRVAELLILREDARSLHACMNEICEILRGLCRNDSMGERLAGELHAQFHYERVEKIMKDGLHEHLMEFLEKASTTCRIKQPLPGPGGLRPGKPYAGTH